MNKLRSFGLLTAALLVVACGGSGPTTPPATVFGSFVPASVHHLTPDPANFSPVPQPSATEAPATEAPPTEAPPSGEPGDDLDPSLSDAGVVGRVTISNDSRGDRDGVHDIIGVAGDGSSCSVSLQGDVFTAYAGYAVGSDGEIDQMGVSLDPTLLPSAGGPPASTNEGRVFIDFVSESGFGTTYSGASSEENGGRSLIIVSLAGDTLVLDYQGTTWDDVDFEGQMTVRRSTAASRSRPAAPRGCPRGPPRSTR